MFRYYLENRKVLETLEMASYELFRTDYNAKGEKIMGDLIISIDHHPRIYATPLNDAWFELYINYKNSSPSFSENNNIPNHAMRIFQLHKFYDSL